MYEYYNPNPYHRVIRDCTQRALSKAFGIDWETASVILDSTAIKNGYNGDAKEVFWIVLKENGYERNSIPNNCPDCYTAADFCVDHPKGTYILGFGDHVCTVVDGVIYDSWDSQKEVPHFFWYKKEVS